jgi:uncharacterized repeat protein (TIGR03803 family)
MVLSESRRLSVFARMYHQPCRILAIVVLCGSIASFSVVQDSRAQTFKTVFNFSGKDGYVPQSPMVALNGVLVGTTLGGGSDRCFGAGCGEIFSFDPTTNSETVLHPYRGNSEGELGSAITVAQKRLFGTLAADNRNGGGSLFSVDPRTGDLTVLYRFDGVNGVGGSHPSSAPVYQAGMLYGTTEDGGPGYSGVVYAFDIAHHKETVLHGFDFSDGFLPNALISHQGMLYGATHYGDGTGCDGHGCGVLFKIDPATGAYTIIHNFTGQPDGGFPQGLMFHGKYIYGVTQMGGRLNRGLLYRIDPETGTEKHLYDFHGGAQPPSPNSVLTYHDGALYGTAGARANYENFCKFNGKGCGAVFKYDLATDLFTVLHSFTGKSDGALPQGGVIYSHGAFYGTTEFRGGPDCHYKSRGNLGCGTIFSITP